MKMRDKIKLLEKENFKLSKHIEKVGYAIWELKGRIEKQGICPYHVLVGNEEYYPIESLDKLKRLVLNLPE
jgi:hypothetical protein